MSDYQHSNISANYLRSKLIFYLTVWNFSIEGKAIIFSIYLHYAVQVLYIEYNKINIIKILNFITLLLTMKLDRWPLCTYLSTLPEYIHAMFFSAAASIVFLLKLLMFMLQLFRSFCPVKIMYLQWCWLYLGETEGQRLSWTRWFIFAFLLWTVYCCVKYVMYDCKISSLKGKIDFFKFRI